MTGAEGGLTPSADDPPSDERIRLRKSQNAQAKALKKAERLRRKSFGRYMPAPPKPIASIEDVVLVDATLIALAAIRLAVKNLVIVRTLRDRKDYDDAFYLLAIRQELQSFAASREEDAVRAAADVAEARTRGGRGEHPSDYRSIDVVTLERRITTMRGLATRLHEIASEEDALRELHQMARFDALDEIAANAERVHDLERTPRLDADERHAALAGLADQLRREAGAHA